MTSGIDAGAITVLIATCGPSPLLSTALARLRRHTPAAVHVRLLHSGDGLAAVETAARRFGAAVQVVESYAISHAAALDAGLAMVETPILVTLDSDAFPIADTWLTTLVEPLVADPRVACVGPRLASLRSVRERPDRLNPYDYRAHICALATTRAFLAETGTTFALAGPAPHLGGLDTGEALTVAALARGRLVVTPPWTAWRVHGTGAVIDGTIFHAFYTSRRTQEDGAFLDAQLRDFFDIGLDELVTRQASLAAAEAAFAAGRGPDPFARWVGVRGPDQPPPWRRLID